MNNKAVALKAVREKVLKAEQIETKEKEAEKGGGKPGKKKGPYANQKGKKSSENDEQSEH
jgi:hypothetical protein